MMFLSLLATMVLEHWRPLRPPFPHYQAFARLTGLLRDKLDGGQSTHGLLAWCCAVLPVVFLVWLLQGWLASAWQPLAWLWGVLVLYLTFGFKYYTLLAEEIAGELRSGQLQLAQAKLDTWRGVSGAVSTGEPQVTSGMIASLTIERLFSHSLRQTFGVLFWFVLLGPAGAVLYRLSSILSRRWREASPGFGEIPGRIFHALNWVPARLAGLTYAVAGNFEDAMLCWRTQSSIWPDPDESVVLSAGAGAMGIRLGVTINPEDLSGLREEIGIGDEPDADQIDSAVSMIWRGLMVWMIAGLLMSLAGWADA